MNHRRQNGFATLATMVVVFFVALLLAMGIQFLGLGELQHGYTSNLGEQAFSIGDGCVDEALQRLRFSPSYAGGTVTHGDDACTIVISGSGGTRQVDVTATVNGLIVREIRARVALTAASPRNVVSVTSWEELVN